MTQVDVPILYGSSTSPFVRKVRMCLHAKAIPYQFKPTSSWNPAGGIEALNPLAKVPVFRTTDGDLIQDSRVIIQYLETAHPAVPLLLAQGMGRIWALRIEALADGIGDATALVVQEGWRRAPSEVWRARQQAKVEQGLRALEAAWSARQTSSGASPGLAEMATVSAIGFARFWQPELQAGIAMPACERLEAAMSLYEWYAATHPVLAPGARFPTL